VTRNLLILLILLGLQSCDDGPKVIPSVAPIGITGANGLDKPSQVSYGTTMSFSSGGMLRAILHAGRVQTFDIKRYTWLDSSVKVDFYDKTGRRSSVLTSASARVNQATNNMTAYTNVRIVSDSGAIVETDSLEWLNKDQTLHSDAPVHIVEPNGRITDGIGFESDQNLMHYRILRPVIVTPSGVFEINTRKNESGPQRSENVLKPHTQSVPGAGAFTTTPPVHIVTDTSQHK